MKRRIILLTGLAAVLAACGQQAEPESPAIPMAQPGSPTVTVGADGSSSPAAGATTAHGAGVITRGPGGGDDHHQPRSHSLNRVARDDHEVQGFAGRIAGGSSRRPHPVRSDSSGRSRRGDGDLPPLILGGVM